MKNVQQGQQQQKKKPIDDRTRKNTSHFVRIRSGTYEEDAYAIIYKYIYIYIYIEIYIETHQPHSFHIHT